MLRKNLEWVREGSTLVHNITNYVTVNDCANMLLACGASPIMSDDIREIEEITSICSGLNINIGTLNKRTIESMFLAGKKSNELGHPVLLDPVGAGASKLRTDTALDLMKEINFTVIRGNASEIKTLALGSGATQGVDANIADKVSDKNLEESITFVKSFSKRAGSIIVLTGEIDIVADENRAFCIRNGNPAMSSITGTGCQLSALIAAYIATNKESPLEAAATAVCAMGVCGELAFRRMSELDGNSTYRNYIIDAMSHLSSAQLEKEAKYEVK